MSLKVYDNTFILIQRRREGQNKQGEGWVGISKNVKNQKSIKQYFLSAINPLRHGKPAIIMECQHLHCMQIDYAYFSQLFRKNTNIFCDD